MPTVNLRAGAITSPLNILPSCVIAVMLAMASMLPRSVAPWAPGSVPIAQG